MLKKVSIRLLTCFLVLLTLAAISVAVIFYAQIYVFDNYLQRVLNKAEAKLKVVDLNYEQLDSDYFHRKIRLYVTLKQKLKNYDKLQMAFDIDVNFMFLGANGTLVSVDNYGNLETIMQELNLSKLKLMGDFDLSVLKKFANFKLESNSLILPNEYMLCTLGQNHLNISATSLDRAKINFSTTGLDCQSNELYNLNRAFFMTLHDFAIELNPSLINNKLFLDKIDFSLADLVLDFSTLYALGFNDNDKVHDKSLRDRLSLKNINLQASTKNKDSLGFSELDLNLKGDYSFAFPYIKNNVIQEPLNFENTVLKLNVNKINLFNLKNLAKVETEQLLNYLPQVITSDFSLNCQDFSFAQSYNQFNSSGLLSFKLANNKIDRLNFNYNLQADKSLLYNLAKQYHYDVELESLLEKGILKPQGNRYLSIINYNSSGLYINNVKQ